MAQTKTVRAGKHGPVPREDNSRRYIGDEPVEVPMTAYYLRRLADEELVEVDEDLPRPISDSRQTMAVDAQDVVAPESLKEGV